MNNCFAWKIIARNLALACLSCCVLGNSLSFAHFPWLMVDQDGHALMFFSESPAERDYHLPESVAEAKVAANDSDQQTVNIDWNTVEDKDFAGRKSSKPVAADTVLSTNFTYGIYHGTLLKYYAQHVRPVGEAPIELPEASRPRLCASVAPAKTGMQVRVTWDGDPLPQASVTIIDAEGERFEDKTDELGQVSFSTAAEGPTGFVIGHVLKPLKGEWDGKPYTSVSHYCTLTTNYQRKTVERMEQKKSALYAPLPEALASFGAAVCDDWLYVYSGHTGNAHAHSIDNLSKGFHRLRLNGQSDWESLPMQTPLQGLPLVGHKGKLYRVGGLHATNAAGEEAVMHSVDEFSRFDPQERTWKALPGLPQARSSHDAVIIDDKLYVVGGWKLSGDSDGEWINQMHAFDLGEAEGRWQSLPGMPSNRRALAVSHWNGKLVAIGGMDEDHSISSEVDCFDPSTSQWSKLADFPGEGMSGFGVSAWNTGGKVFASGSEGKVYQLSKDGKAWNAVAELGRARFFHRLLAKDDSELLIIGGAPLDEEGHLSDVESIGL